MTSPTPWETMDRSGKEAACRPLLAKGLTYRKIARVVGAPSRNSIGTIAASLRLKDGTPLRRFPSPTETRDARKKRRAAAAKMVVKQLSDEIGQLAAAGTKPEKAKPAPRGRKMRLIAGVEQVQIGGGPKAASKYDIKGRAAQRAASPGLLPEKAAAQLPISRRLTLVELTDWTCRFPHGDPRLEDFYFCGAAKDFDRSYCAAHEHLARQTPRERTA